MEAHLIVTHTISEYGMIYSVDIPKIECVLLALLAYPSTTFLAIAFPSLDMGINSMR